MAIDLDNIQRASGKISLTANITHSTRFTELEKYGGRYYLEILNFGSVPIYYTIDFEGTDETAVTPTAAETFAVPAGGRSLHRVPRQGSDAIVNMEAESGVTAAVQLKDLSV